MVYDPIRDIDVPSPAASTQSDQPWRQNITPGSGAYFDPARQVDYGNSPNGHGAVYDGRPPAFHGAGSSPSSTMGMRRSVSGGLRGLLNDEEEDTSRRSSAQSGFDGNGGMEEDHRPSISRILNSGPGDGGAMAKSTSYSSRVSSSPANASPVISGRPLDNSGFLTPASTSRRASRSPYPVNSSVSPALQHAMLPHDGHALEYEAQLHPQAGPSRRRVSGGQSNPRPMLPPDTIPRQEYYDPSRITPGAQSYPLPMRSPSISVSPRSHHQALGGQLSRPTSSSSMGQPFSFQPPPLPAESPSYATRQLSEAPSRPSSGSQPPRQSSLVPRDSGRSSVASRTPLRSPTPLRVPYQPNRMTQPTSVLRPILPDEVARMRSAAMVNNPLRRRPRKAAPSWSGPSPGARADRSSLPAESDSSYFPATHQTPEPGPSRKASQTSRRDGSVSAGLTSVTPGGTAVTPTETNSKGPKGSGKRKQSSQEAGNDEQRRKGNDGHYVGNSAVASHCESCLNFRRGWRLMLR